VENIDEKELIKALQDDIALCAEPFKAIAGDMGVSEESLIAAISEFLAEGKMRRFGAVLRHQNVGFKYNGMGIWNVPDEKVLSAAKEMVSFKEVSHCYERPRFPSWKYNMYTMIHSTTKEECEAVARKISEKTGITDYDILASTREFKKSSVTYY